MTQVQFIPVLLPDRSLPAESRAFVSQQVQQEAGQYVSDAQAAQAAAEAARDEATTEASRAKSVVDGALETIEIFDLQSSNLFDATKVTPDIVLPVNSATPVPNTQYVVSDPIPVEQGADYTYHRILRVTYIDAHGDFVGFFSLGSNPPYTYQPHAGATHVRLSVAKANLDVAQMNRGPTLLPYEPGGVGKIPARFLDLPDGAVVDVATADHYIQPPGLTEPYTAPTIPDQLTLGSTTSADVYSWYDNLAATHPDYVTRTDLGVASDGTTHLYAYTLDATPVPTDSPSLTVQRPAALLISGVHGFEKAAVATLYHFARVLCEDWADHPMLDAIRWGVELVIVPLGSPTSYDQNPGGARKNSNGVDIARNFPAGWTLGSDPESSVYGGPSPLSEPETVILNDLMASMKGRCVWGASFHNFSAVEGSGRFLWQAAASTLQLHVGKEIISRMTRKWRADRAWVTSTDEYFGYADMASPGGSEGRQMVAHGIHGATFETSRVAHLGPGGVVHDSNALTLGLEAQAAFVALGIEQGIQFHNRHGKPTT